MPAENWLVRAANDSRKAHSGEFFAEGEDRASHYPDCMCFDRFTGGPALHPGGSFDSGPCYMDEDDLAGFYPP